MTEPTILIEFDDCGRSDLTVSEAVVSAVSDFTDQSPLEMTPLGKTIDTDALNALFHAANVNESGLIVTFEYSDCLITIDSDKVQVKSMNDG